MTTDATSIGEDSVECGMSCSLTESQLLDGVSCLRVTYRTESRQLSESHKWVCGFSSEVTGSEPVVRRPATSRKLSSLQSLSK